MNYNPIYNSIGLFYTNFKYLLNYNSFLTKDNIFNIFIRLTKILNKNIIKLLIFNNFRHTLTKTNKKIIYNYDYFKIILNNYDINNKIYMFKLKINNNKCKYYIYIYDYSNTYDGKDYIENIYLIKKI